MKKIAILVASVLVLGGFNSKAFAAGAATQTTQTTEATATLKDQAGITPDSLLYAIDKAVDNLRILLATSDEKKTEVIADVAEERLGESEVMIDAGKAALAQKALLEYNDKINEAAEKLQVVVTKTQDTDDEKVEAKVDGLEKAFQNVQGKALDVLKALQTKVEDKDAEKTVEKITEEQQEHKDAVKAFVEARHTFNEAKKDLNMAKVAAKKAEKGEDPAALKAAQDSLNNLQTAYNTAKTSLQTAFQTKKSLEGNKKDDVKPASTDTTTVDQINKAVDKAKDGNGSKDKSSKVEKQDNDKKDKEKSAPGKSEEDHGKSEQSNGNKK